jgi:hypothetical protein
LTLARADDQRCSGRDPGLQCVPPVEALIDGVEHTFRRTIPIRGLANPALLFLDSLLATRFLSRQISKRRQRSLPAIGRGIQGDAWLCNDRQEVVGKEEQID